MSENRGNGIILPKDVNEIELTEYFINKHKFSSPILYLVVNPTYICNFRCEYCIAEGVRGTSHMSKDTAMGSVKWVEECIKGTRPKEIWLIITGGEPLLNFDIVKFIIENIAKKAIEFNCGFYSSVLTNGSLAFVDNIKILKECGLSAIQFTLDGPPEVHNKRRKALNPKHNFDSILKNLKDCSNIFEYIDLRINIDKENFSYLDKLLDILEKEGLKDKVLIHLARVIQLNKQICSSTCDFLSSIEEWRLKEYNNQAVLLVYKGYETLLKRGFRIRKSFEDLINVMSPCMFCIENAYVIDPLGDIYKCPDLVGIKDFCAGNIFDKKLNWKGIQSVVKKFYKSGCENCKFFPICLGGCRFMAYLRNGDINSIYCEKKMWETKINLLPKVFD